MNLNPGRWGDFAKVQGPAKNARGIPLSLEWTKTYLPLFCLDKSNTFWTSLALGLYDDWQLYALAKAKISLYYAAVIADGGHPRNAEYRLLSAESVRKGTGTLASQFQAAPTSEVSPESWQIIADCFRIELLIISGDPRPNAAGQLPVVPRGDHNNRQVILRRGADNEYYFVRPDKPNPYKWRYDAHIVRDLMQLPVRAKNLLDYINDNTEMAVRQCPFLQTDGDGLPVVPHVTITGYNGLFEPPDRLLDEADPRPHPSNPQLLAYQNNGQWF